MSTHDLPARYGIDLDRAVDTSTPDGRCVAAIVEAVLAAIDQREREVRGERASEALAAKRERGERAAGRPSALPDDVLARIARLREDGHTLRGIASVLEDDGIPTATGCDRWYASTVSTALAAREYERRLAENRVAYLHGHRDEDAAS